MEKILKIITNELQIKISDIKRHDRNKDLTIYRQLCMYVLWQNTNLTLYQIGQLINRCAASVSHGYQKIADKMRSDYKIKYWVLRLNRIINEALDNG